MPEFSRRNLCKTVENRPQYMTLKCTVRSEKARYTLPRFVFDPTDPDYMSEKFLYHFDHRWSDHAGGMQGGRCEKCGKTRKECLVRINPKTGEPVRKASRIAREIALMPADVPPVRMIGGQHG